MGLMEIGLKEATSGPNANQGVYPIMSTSNYSALRRPPPTGLMIISYHSLQMFSLSRRRSSKRRARAAKADAPLHTMLSVLLVAFGGPQPIPVKSSNP